MKRIGQGLAVILAVNILISIILVACTTKHSVLFLNEACIKPYKRYDYHTCEDMNVVIDGDYYVVPKDFQTDLASIPRVLWPILAPQYAGFVAPAILHDYLYSCGNLGTRKWADEVLYSALISEGVTRYTASKFYLGVRLFGGRHFDDKNNY